MRSARARPLYTQGATARKRRGLSTRMCRNVASLTPAADAEQSERLTSSQNHRRVSQLSDLRVET